MFYTIYKTTNKVNNKIYIGKHQTNDLNDEYLGSGQNIKRAIEKYGIDNFTKEILCIFDTEEEMNQKEKELVTPEFCLRKDTYNITIGGSGSFWYINENKTKEERIRVAKLGRKATDEILEERYGENWRFILGKIASKQGGIKFKEKYQNDENFAELVKSNLKKASDLALSTTAKKKRKETMRQNNHQQGEKNSNYGKIWIRNLELKECITINKKEEIPEGWEKGRIFNW